MLLASGLIYECGDETNGEFKKYGSKGYCIYDLSYIHNSPAELIILSSSSSDTSNLLNNTPFIHLSTGKATNIGITSTGHTYSWGDGELGELGLGAGNRKTSCPMQMKSMEEAVSCSSGTNHSLLIDRHGRLFAWGGNKSCQLGLHASWKVEAFDDVNKNDFFEEIFLFVPRLIPTSLKNPALQVACGDEFSVILTVEGRLWTCGSNQCGQLGRGNISRRERLAELNSPEQKFVSIAAGSYHAVAATAKSIFCWGLNTLGQVGTDDGSCKSFSTPTLVYTAEGGDQIVQVYASKHSSAARLSSGRLLTWGDGRHHRLLQDDTHTVWKPTLVERLLNEKICRFLFTPTGAAFCSESFVTKTYPAVIPVGCESPVIVSGVNLWDDGKIQVSFQHEDEPSRIITSVLGQLLDGEIHFNTPVFSEPGDYAVSIALDGYTYLPQKLSLFVHPSLSLGRPATSIINRRAQASHLYNLPVDIIGCADDDDMMRRMLSSEVFVRALFIEQLVVSNNDDELPIEAVILAKGVFNGPNMIQVTIDFSELCVKKTLFLQFAVSLNGRDFSAPQESDNVGFLLTHCTQILSLSPSCILEPLSGDGESERTIAFRLGADSLLDVTNFPSTVGLYCQFSAQGVVPRIRRPVSVSPDLLLTMRVPSIAEFFESAVGAMEQSSDIVVNDLPKTLTITMEIEAEIIDESIIPPPSALSSVDIVEFSDNSKATQEPCGASELKPDIVYEEGTRGSAFANDSGIQDIELAFDPSPSNIIQEISDHVSTDSISLQTCCKNETVLSDDPELQAKSDIQLNDVVERSENDDDEVPNATTSDVNWRTPLEIGAPTLTLCVPYLINVSPLMMRSSGSTQVIVSGLHGQMNGCLAVLLDGSTGALLCDPVPCVEMRDETLKDDDTDVKADESCTKGPFVAFNFNPQLSEPVERAHVCIVPDGINRWPVACSPVISIFDKIQLKTPSKAKAGALAQLIVSGIRFQDEIEPFSAMVRLSLLPPVLGDSNEIYKSNSSLSIDPTNDDLGNNVLPCSWIDVLGRLVMEQTVAAKGGKNSVANSAPAQLKVTFTLPSLSALSGLPTKTDSKTAPLMLYVGLSIDSAQSFDFSDKPILTIDVK